MPKSWDIQPGSKTAPRRGALQRPRPSAKSAADAGTSAPGVRTLSTPRADVGSTERRARQSKTSRGVMPLREKRKAKRRTILKRVGLLIIFLAVCADIVLWQSFVRV